MSHRELGLSTAEARRQAGIERRLRALERETGIKLGEGAFDPEDPPVPDEAPEHGGPLPGRFPDRQANEFELSLRMRR